ncbi:hypothetical protein COX05_03925 [candidate division WWE3 bacterium CG22_combo_CG10-13_8_21_14_all_39_12]|uniref:Small ribosomal subunit protein bS20 n=2 Tax=Katanobacteria TaxID=422282 RepID=A0A2M7X3W1_UNCKA|nr:MAG: hypothetical protein COX05_03925 [candidate division WWE3 bacterium CG22_combo_CG10-13_8_21_14_all_39_12]PJA40828.1 MAG: hypothetical protein CO179_01240 [candidate division WWE3 bacterium CG_4_9_14_3_um_filter_39_7]
MMEITTAPERIVRCWSNKSVLPLLTLFASIFFTIDVNYDILQGLVGQQRIYMATTKSAKRTIPKQERKRVVNLRNWRTLREKVKSFIAAPSKELEGSVYSAIDTAAKKGLIHKNKAAHLKSQMSKLQSA